MPPAMGRDTFHYTRLLKNLLFALLASLPFYFLVSSVVWGVRQSFQHFVEKADWILCVWEFFLYYRVFYSWSQTYFEDSFVEFGSQHL